MERYPIFYKFSQISSPYVRTSFSFESVRNEIKIKISWLLISDSSISCVAEIAFDCSPIPSPYGHLGSGVAKWKGGGEEKGCNYRRRRRSLSGKLGETSTDFSLSSSFLLKPAAAAAAAAAEFLSGARGGEEKSHRQPEIYESTEL